MNKQQLKFIAGAICPKKLENTVRIGIITNIEINNERKNHILKNLNIIIFILYQFLFWKRN